MIRRLRFLSGILALVAMSFSMGQGLRAATCASMDPAGGAAISVHVPDATAEQQSSPSHHGETHGENGGECPFAPVASAGGCVSAAVVAAVIESPPAFIRPLEPVIASGSHSELLLEISLFRPPRA